MAKSSKPKEIVVVGSKIKETSDVPDGLTIDIGDELLAKLSWDIDLVPTSSGPPPGFMTSFVDPFEPQSSVEYPFGLFLESPLGITMAINDNAPRTGDEVLVTFLYGDARGRLFEFGLHLEDPTGTAFDGLPATTPLNLRLQNFSTATVLLREVGAAEPFATGDVLSLESHVVPEPGTFVLLVSMLGTLAVHRFFRRDKSDKGAGSSA